uniref:Uncharacterized protein n=1 Tax=Helianthus annuus TaxID=4232 RepID=A0A251U988_HELAN
MDQTGQVRKESSNGRKPNLGLLLNSRSPRQGGCKNIDNESKESKRVIRLTRAR